MWLVIGGFHNVIGLPNSCGAIVGTHCQLYCKSLQILYLNGYWCTYDIYNVLLQEIETVKYDLGFMCESSKRDSWSNTLEGISILKKNERGKNILHVVIYGKQILLCVLDDYA